MAQVIVRDLADDVVASLKRKAELHGRWLDHELRDALAQAARLTVAERVAIADPTRAMTPADTPQVDSAELIRQDRDSRWSRNAPRRMPPQKGGILAGDSE